MTTNNPEQICCDNDFHAGHMCELESQEEWDTIKQITNKPEVKCENCGAEANFARNVCMPTER